MALLYVVNNVLFTEMYILEPKKTPLCEAKLIAITSSNISASCQLVAGKVLILMSVTENGDYWAASLIKHYQLLNISLFKNYVGNECS